MQRRDLGNGCDHAMQGQVLVWSNVKVSDPDALAKSQLVV